MRNNKKISLPIMFVIIVVLVVGCGVLTASAKTGDLSDLDDLAASSSDPLQTFREKQKELQAQMDKLEEQIAAQSSIISGYKTRSPASKRKYLPSRRKLMLFKPL